MEFGELLKLILVDLQRLFRSQIIQGKLTLPQLLLISSIPDNGIDMTTLAQQLGVDNSTLTRLVDILLKRRWVLKKKSSVDHRITLLFLTLDGEKIQDMIEERIDYFGNQLYNAIPQADRDEVKEILSAFQWHLSKIFLKQS